MAGNLTPWEKDQIKTIDKLIQKCKLRYYAFEREHILLNTAAPRDVETLKKGVKESVPERLRYFAADLYSALDYLCYVSYCHFKNDGEPSYSPEARNVKFPYKNLKKSNPNNPGGLEVSFRRQREKFVRDHFTTIFGPQDASTQERFDRFEKIILNCQVITSIDEGGQPLQQQEQMNEAATYFNILRFLRNITGHRHLVDINVDNSWLYVNLRDGSREFVPEQIPARDNDPDQWQSIQLSLDCCITIPSSISSRMENGHMPKQLLIVTDEILKFVIDTRNELLEIAFPSVDIPKFHDEVRRGLNDGVHFVRQPNPRRYSWNEFDEKCGVMCTSESDLWAV